MKTNTKKLVRALAVVALAALLIPSSGVLYAQTGASQTPSGNSSDTVEPEDVENLRATAGDGEIQLSWDTGIDNLSVTGYKIYRGSRSVQTENDRYDLPTIPAGNVTTYTVRNLTNEQTYYFTVTALDAAGNESVNYSNEVSATPRMGLNLTQTQDDGLPPQVRSVEAEDVVTVKVVFSEPMRLPEEQPQSAFTIEKITDRSRLMVQNAEVDSRDSTGATVLLTTAPQDVNAEYVLTAGIELQDYSNNPIVSGTSDTGSFRGSAMQRTRPTAPTQPAQQTAVTPPPAQNSVLPTALSSPPPADTTPPALVSGTVETGNRITLNFSERVRLPQNPASQTTVTKRGTQQRLNIVNVSLSVDGRNIYITTGPQEAVEYEVRANGITDDAGNNLVQNAVIVVGSGTLRDLVPPEDITRLVARVKDAQRHIVELRWQGSRNSAGDLYDQLLYQNRGRNALSFGSSTSLGTTTTSVEVHDLNPGNWYTFKITTKDTSNNESAGVRASVFLPQTGPGMIAGGLTALLMGWYSKRRKKRKN